MHNVCKITTYKNIKHIGDAVPLLSGVLFYLNTFHLQLAHMRKSGADVFHHFVEKRLCTIGHIENHNAFYENEGIQYKSMLAM